MANRAPDWLAQANHDLDHAGHALEDGDYDWACFAAHQAARRLDKHYIPTRYPNGFDAGAPLDFYTADEARRAIEDAERIHDFC